MAEMSGLLSDVLPFLYSQGDRAKRYAKTLLSDPIGTVQQALGQVVDSGRENRTLLNAAIDDKFNYNPAAGQAFGERALTGLLGFAPFGITAWHGSPHKFDKFDSSKIGTGEGAQAYGHGLYLAESPDVAKSYQSALSADRGFGFGGKTGLTRAEVQDMVNAKYGAGYLDGVIRPSGVADSFIDDMVTGTVRASGAYPRNYKPGSQRAKVYDELRGQIVHADPGSLYKVDLPDPMIARMLDWDKPLADQPGNVMEMINRAGMYDEMSGMTGADIWKRLIEKQTTPLREWPQQGGWVAHKKAAPQRATEQLRSLGIPGIRYLDGGSRGNGAGTSNFVIFPGEENLLTILERNGVPLR